MGHLAQFGDVGDAEQGVVHRFGVDDLCVGMLGKGFLDSIEVLHIHEGSADVELLQVVGHKSEGAAIGGHRSDDVVACVDFVEKGAGDSSEAGACNPSHISAFHSGKTLTESKVGGVPVTAVEEVALGFAVEGLSHKMSFGESESGAVADCGVNTTVGIASVDALDCCCRIKFLHNQLFYINILFKKVQFLHSKEIANLRKIIQTPTRNTVLRLCKLIFCRCLRHWAAVKVRTVCDASVRSQATQISVSGWQVSDRASSIWLFR